MSEPAAPRYDFRTGYPDLSIIPASLTEGLAPHILTTAAGQQYSGDLQGVLETRVEVARFLSENGSTTVTADELMIITGALTGIDVICRTFTQPGDIVLVEDPTFFFAIEILKMSRVQVLGVPVRADGIDLDYLETLLKKHGDKIRLLYAIPSFQNPTGTCLALDKRQALIKLAQQYNFIIADDTTYQNLYFAQQPPPILKALDPDSGHNIAIGSFSKLLMPSLRQGWIWATREQIKALTRFKADGGTSRLSSEIVRQYLQSGEMDAQIKKVRAFYGRKCQLMGDALAEYLPDAVQWTVPDGGFFIWLTLPDGLTAPELRREALKQGVDFLPGRECSVDLSGEHTLRLCFSMLPEAMLPEGIERLGQAVKAALR